MKKKIEMTQEQEYMDTQVRTPEELIQDEKSEKQLAETLQDEEEMTVGDADSADEVDVEERVKELTESLE